MRRKKGMRTMQRRTSILIFFRISLAAILVSCLAAPRCAMAQERTERTIEEIKAEAVTRAENGMYPVIGLDPNDLREAFKSIKTRDKEEWAAAFIGCWRSLHGRGKIPRNIRSRESERRLYSGMADLFFWALAFSFLAGKAARLRKSTGSFPRSHKILGPSDGDRPHSIRGQRDHRVFAAS